MVEPWDKAPMIAEQRAGNVTLILEDGFEDSPQCLGQSHAGRNFAKISQGASLDAGAYILVAGNNDLDLFPGRAIAEQQGLMGSSCDTSESV